MFSLAMLLAGRQDALHIVTNFLSKNNDEACWTRAALEPVRDVGTAAQGVEVSAFCE